MTDKASLARSTEGKFRRRIAVIRAELASVQTQMTEPETARSGALPPELVMKEKALAAELRAWEDALRIVRGVQYKPSGSWKRMLVELTRQFPPPTVFNSTHIKTLAEQQGLGFRPVNVRMQMLNFIRYGLVERLEPGRFRFTRTGIDLIRGWNRTAVTPSNHGDRTEDARQA